MEPYVTGSESVGMEKEEESLNLAYKKGKAKPAAHLQIWFEQASMNQKRKKPWSEYPHERLRK